MIRGMRLYLGHGFRWDVRERAGGDGQGHKKKGFILHTLTGPIDELQDFEFWRLDKKENVYQMGKLTRPSMGTGPLLGDQKSCETRRKSAETFTV